MVTSVEVYILLYIRVGHNAKVIRVRFTLH